MNYKRKKKQIFLKKKRRSRKAPGLRIEIQEILPHSQPPQPSQPQPPSQPLPPPQPIPEDKRLPKPYCKPRIENIDGRPTLIVTNYKYPCSPELTDFLSASTHKFVGIIPFYWWTPSKIKWKKDKERKGYFKGSHQTVYSDLLQIYLIFGIINWKLNLVKIKKDEPVNLDLLYDTFYKCYPDFMDEPREFIPIHKTKGFHIYIAYFGLWNKTNKTGENINDKKILSTYLLFSQVKEQLCDIFGGIYQYNFSNNSVNNNSVNNINTNLPIITIDECPFEIDLSKIISRLLGYYQFDFSFKKNMGMFQTYKANKTNVKTQEIKNLIIS